MRVAWHVLACVMIASQGLRAQQPTTPTGVAVATVTDPFARYVTPGQCQQAALRLMRQYWRDKRPDTVVYAPATDSVPAPVAQAIRSCTARFTLAATPATELRNLAQLYVWTSQDSMARHALRRLTQVERSQPPRDRGWTLSLWINALLSAKPARFALVHDYLAQLDTLGAPAAPWRVDAHVRVAQYAFSINNRVAAEAEARAAVAASRQMAIADRVDRVGQIERAYLTLALTVALSRGRSAALALLDTMMVDLTPLRPPGSSDQQQLVAGFQQDRLPFTFLGKSGFASVHADAWYGPPGDTIHPRPGRLSLLFFIYGPDYPMFATLRRLSVEYANHGLDLVGMTTTRGYFRTLPMPSPAVEADSIGSYTTRFLHLPIVLAAEYTPFTHLADGRRQNQKTGNIQTYGRVGALLIDRNGVVLWVGDLSPSSEAVWDALIRAAP